MSFREKIAWLTLGGLLLAFGPYFGTLLLLGKQPWLLGPAGIGLFLIVVTALMIVMTIGGIAIAFTNIRDAERPSDERDRHIARRASAIAYAVLIPALFLALGTLVFGVGQTLLVNAVLAAIVIAELVRCTIEILGYRRGW
jgi:O-antigen/teichoic acid export membrane protein